MKALLKFIPAYFICVIVRYLLSPVLGLERSTFDLLVLPIPILASIILLGYIKKRKSNHHK